MRKDLSERLEKLTPEHQYIIEGDIETAWENRIRLFERIEASRR